MLGWLHKKNLEASLLSLCCPVMKGHRKNPFFRDLKEFTHRTTSIEGFLEEQFFFSWNCSKYDFIFLLNAFRDSRIKSKFYYIYFMALHLNFSFHPQCLFFFPTCVTSHQTKLLNLPHSTVKLYIPTTLCCNSSSFFLQKSYSKLQLQ